MVLSLTAAELVICAISSAPVVLLWRWLAAVSPSDMWLRWTILGAALVPSYVLFALCLLAVSPAVTRTLGWRTPPDVELRIGDYEWPLLAWARSVASAHVCRLIAGTLLRGTPVWTAHLRWCGARLGRRVYVNSLSLNDYNLIECGDDVVIGDGVHLSGHTVEAGLVKTGRVVLGDRVTIGLGAIVEIDVRIGSDVLVGALSFVPKHARLEDGGVYVGVPVRRLP